MTKFEELMDIISRKKSKDKVSQTFGEADSVEVAGVNICRSRINMFE